MNSIELTCRCIKSIKYDDVKNDHKDCWNHQNIKFVKGHKYVVDVYPTHFEVYQNDGLDGFDSIVIDQDFFNEHFKIIG